MRVYMCVTDGIYNVFIASLSKLQNLKNLASIVKIQRNISLAEPVSIKMSVKAAFVIDTYI